MLKKILVVDDNEDNLFIISEVLRDDNYAIKTLDSAVNLQNEVFIFNPDLIVLDVCIGEVDGRIICDQLKASPQTKHIKVILISARYSSIQSENAGYSSCDHFIEKPFDIADLSEKVSSLLYPRTD